MKNEMLPVLSCRSRWNSTLPTHDDPNLAHFNPSNVDSPSSLWNVILPVPSSRRRQNCQSSLRHASTTRPTTENCKQAGRQAGRQAGGQAGGRARRAAGRAGGGHKEGTGKREHS